MRISHSAPALYRLLLVDAATCTGMGMALTLWSGAIGEMTRIPPLVLPYAGVVLFPVAAFMAVIATRPIVQPTGVWLIVLGNALWVAASLFLLISGFFAPNALGTIFVSTQALARSRAWQARTGPCRRRFGYAGRPEWRSTPRRHVGDARTSVPGIARLRWIVLNNSIRKSG